MGQSMELEEKEKIEMQKRKEKGTKEEEEERKKGGRKEGKMGGIINEKERKGIREHSIK